MSYLVATHHQQRSKAFKCRLRSICTYANSLQQKNSELQACTLDNGCLKLYADSNPDSIPADLVARKTRDRLKIMP